MHFNLICNDRLLEEKDTTQCFDVVLQLGHIACEEQDRRLAKLLHYSQLADELESVDNGHFIVGDDEVVVRHGLHKPESLLAVRRGVDLRHYVEPLKQVKPDFKEFNFVVKDEYFFNNYLSVVCQDLSGKSAVIFWIRNFLSIGLLTWMAARSSISHQPPEFC